VITLPATMRRALQLRHPKTTVRWRLAALYGGLFLASGATLLAITYALVDHATVSRTPHILSLPGVRQRITPPGASTPRQSEQVRVNRPPPGFEAIISSPTGRDIVRFVGSQQRISDLHQLEIESGIALAIMALISGTLGWLIAGRVLRPLRTITVTTRQISERNLHRRLALRGPSDELRELADTIDGLLERLETAFDTQRRFVANASHELRTPLTTARALLEMTMSDPEATLDTFRETSRQVLEENERQEQLIDALLTLAQGQRGLDHREILDLARVTGDVLGRLAPEIEAHGLELCGVTEAALVSGDRRLIERLVTNLTENAIHHNIPNGHIRFDVETCDGHATVMVTNSGPAVPSGEIDRLLQPFQRLAAERTGPHDGLGLGLSIVAAVVDAHGAELGLSPRAGGGLHVEVRFPVTPGGDPSSHVHPPWPITDEIPDDRSSRSRV
jgi:signal transduction histidine kinase